MSGVTHPLPLSDYPGILNLVEKKVWSIGLLSIQLCVSLNFRFWEEEKMCIL